MTINSLLLKSATPLVSTQDALILIPKYLNSCTISIMSLLHNYIISCYICAHGVMFNSEKHETRMPNHFYIIYFDIRHSVFHSYFSDTSTINNNNPFLNPYA